MHTLPHALTEMWQRGQIGVAALPRLLAMVERRLKPGDYLGVRGLHTRRYVKRITLWVMLVLGLLGPILVAWVLSGESDVRFLILVSFLAVEIPCGLLLIPSVCWLMHERHLRRALLDACADESNVTTAQANSARARPQ
jgi:hypothetical protein